jgi:hypothetical protein
MHSPRLPLGALSIGLAASLLAGSAWAGPARFEQRAATPARFESWSPLSDYVTAGLGEGGTFRLTLPTRLGNVEVSHVKVFFGPRKAKARNVTSTSLVVKVPKKHKSVLGNAVAVSVVRDGIASANALSFTYATPTP